MRDEWRQGLSLSAWVPGKNSGESLSPAMPNGWRMNLRVAGPGFCILDWSDIDV